MAFFTLNRSAHQAMPAIFNGVSAGGILANLSTALRVWNDKRITRTELEMLSDRELADIGLTRGGIERLVENLK